MHQGSDSASAPRVSVVIPLYNHEGYIEQAAQSVLDQTFTDLELVILDDGSKDNSYAVAERIAAKDARVRLYRQENQGIVAAFNKLASLARGEFICHLGSDDILMPERLAWGIDDMEHDANLSACFCAFSVIDKHGAPSKTLQAPRLGALSGRDLAQYLVVANCLGALTAFMRRSALEENQPFARPFAAVHDWDLWLRLAHRGKLKLRAEVGGLYRWHGDNISQKNERESARQQLIVLEQMAPKLIEAYEFPMQTWMQVHARMAMHAMQLQDYPRAAQHLATKGKHSSLQDHEAAWLADCLQKCDGLQAEQR